MPDLDRLIEQAPSTLDRFRLDGKHAIVVGGNRGLGQAMAMGLAAAGADVCVVGAGLAGLSAALELRQRGFTVALLEAKTVGWGASGRNAGHVLPTLIFQRSWAITIA